uniref:Rieske domain-containing protein n=1 Tax=Alexandrium catenella TaxID=2925 RepID=A0A7S1VZU3_ALECA|mmetsp:Transcript_33905/g.91782  ORF Transcript_33905/g.91782 Transcript_33905/m.91782 type:complete len:317 (+) Transcript_33905:94-1044(+)
MDAPGLAASQGLYFDEVDQQTGEPWRFLRTNITEVADLTNGRAWIQTFEHVLKNLPKPRRALGISLSDSGDPRYSMPAYGVKQRNDAAKAMREPEATPGLPDGARRGVGTQLKLPSGDEVLLVCNIGPNSPAELPRKFREMPLHELSFLAVAAKCPHQGGCLNEGEIKDVEDIASMGTQMPRRAIIRCPWHNMQFDLHSGEGIGNHLQLARYPVRVAHGAVYIGVRFQNGTFGGGAGYPAAATAAPCIQPLDSGVAPGQEPSMDVDMDMDGGGACQSNPAGSLCSGFPPAAMAAPAHGTTRSRSPPRQLRQHRTMF